ncbi:hypothetical protein ISCGN_032069 [Ixodes scapularis]
MINILYLLFTPSLLKSFEACNYFLSQSPGQSLVYGPLLFERADDKKQRSLKEQTTVRTIRRPFELEDALNPRVVRTTRRFSLVHVGTKKIHLETTCLCEFNPKCCPHKQL